MEARLLNGSLFLDDHVNVVRLAPEDNKLIQTIMVYVHPTKKPAGQNIPDQCPKCLFIRPFLVKKGSSIFNAILQCKNLACGTQMEICFPYTEDGFKPVKGTIDAKGGQWLKSLTVV